MRSTHDDLFPVLIKPKNIAQWHARANSWQKERAIRLPKGFQLTTWRRLIG
jgi:hypothetical protein